MLYMQTKLCHLKKVKLFLTSKPDSNPSYLFLLPVISPRQAEMIAYLFNILVPVSSCSAQLSGMFQLVTSDPFVVRTREYPSLLLPSLEIVSHISYLWSSNFKQILTARIVEEQLPNSSSILFAFNYGSLNRMGEDKTASLT